ncbi:hypothetical protein CN279_11895 [Bacillus anthracis]|nr:hypothetical protein CN279_11895 [Bacillus anthracis]
MRYICNINVYIKLLKAIYYVSQKVIKLKLVKYKLKLKKLKNNVKMKREQLITVAPFSSLITHDAISNKKPHIFYFYSALVSKVTSV